MAIAYFAAGAVSCSFSVKGVKKLIRQERPLHAKKKVSYGSVQLSRPSSLELMWTLWEQDAVDPLCDHNLLRCVCAARLSFLADTSQYTRWLLGAHHPSASRCTMVNIDRDLPSLAGSPYLAAGPSGVCVWRYVRVWLVCHVGERLERVWEASRRCIGRTNIPNTYLRTFLGHLYALQAGG